tara:strand:+ start:2189 stop:2440 length:252 start_codon:yes stop_codon:yes gene_type:complete
MRADTSDLRQFVVVAEVSYSLPVRYYGFGPALPDTDQPLDQFVNGCGVEVHDLRSSSNSGISRFCGLQARAELRNYQHTGDPS